jgi:lysylphosphatidylglycerol synthetase-like protein (DUF2156 family)
VADDLVISLPVGARVLVVANLRLQGPATAASTLAADQLERALFAWSGPGAVVVAGDLFDLGDLGQDAVVPALDAHSRLRDALKDFSAGPGRRLIVLPGLRDAGMSASPVAAATLAGSLGAELAPAALVELCTAAGVRAVRVEPGDPVHLRTGSSGVGTPPGYPRLADILPGVWRGSTSGWLAGMSELDDPAAAPRFVASRLVYRQFGRRAWLLGIPVLVALLARLPVAFLRPARHVASDLLITALLASALELVVLLALAAVCLRQVWLAFSGQAGRPRDLNEGARGTARALVADGLAGLITATTCRAELSQVGDGFYANAGSCSEVVSEYLPRLGGLGLPSPFLASLQVSWVELEAGNELHARLLYGSTLSSGATAAERLLARVPSPEPPSPAGGSDDGLVSTPEARRSVMPWRRQVPPPVPVVAASFPHGQAWPRQVSFAVPHRRTRRWAALVVAAAGLVSLLSAVAGSVAHRLRLVSQVLPLAVPQAAGAVTALGGIGLIMLARGILRGQRRAFIICQATLVGVALLHVLRADSLVPTVVALAVAGFLAVRRESFLAASDLPPVRRGLPLIAALALATIAVGTLTLEGSSWITTRLHHRSINHLGWGQALLATVERMVAVQDVPLPGRLNGFFTPAMTATATGLALVAAWMVFRPVVGHRPRAGTEGGLERAREVVDRYGAGTLDYFALRSDKQFYFWAETVVAYAVYGGVCLVSPDPVGPLAQREGAWRRFHNYADSNGWSLAVLGAGEDWLPIYRASGMHDLYLGDEAVVRMERFSLDGGRFKGLRQAVKRVGRHGYTITFHDPAEVSPELAGHIQEVMTKSRRGGVERGFSMTLGRIFDPGDKGLLLAVVHGPPPEGSASPGPPVAFCQYVPAPAINGFSLDLMRRDNSEHPNGLIDFAIVETIHYLAERHYQGLGLNFATMRAVLAGEAGDGLSQKVQAWLVRRMSGSMQIESLWRFNAKFDPDWQPRYAVYDSPEHALPAALAVARAESFWELPLIGRFLVPSSQRQPDGGRAGAPLPAERAGP